MFSVCSHGGGGEAPQPGSDGVCTPWYVPRYVPPGQCRYPTWSGQDRWGYSGQVQGGGGYPPVKVGTPGQVRMGEGYPKVGTPSQGRYAPRPGQDVGVPQGRYPLAKVDTPIFPNPQDRTAYGVLDTLQSVCLLLPRRSTFLFIKENLPYSDGLMTKLVENKEKKSSEATPFLCQV